MARFPASAPRRRPTRDKPDFKGSSPAEAPAHSTDKNLGNQDLQRFAARKLSGGQPLEARDRSFFESRLQTHLDDVRLHTGPTGQRLASGLSARALTSGHDIAFGPGEYRPASDEGRQLLAHEIAHVVQDRAAPATPGPGVSWPGDAAEREAELAATAVQRGDTPPPLRERPAAALQRQPLPFADPIPAPLPPISLQPGGDLRNPMTPVTVSLDEGMPWMALAGKDDNRCDVSLALYGIDLSQMFEIDVGMWGMADAAGKVRIKLFPGLLRPVYADRLHELMEDHLARDASRVKSVLRETWVDDDDEDTILGILRWWSQCRDLRDRSGISYFDRFLGRLDDDQYVTDYLVTESAAHSYLGLLHDEIEDDAGELVGLISQNSERFGGYRPRLPVPRAPQATALSDKSGELVERTTNQLLDRMVGFTCASDEGGIVGMVTALPPPMQARVLESLMGRTSDRTLKIFNRTGEQSGVGMLHFLFEDLEDEDKRKLGDSLRDNGVLTSEAVEALIEGRTWAGRNLPWSTKLGEEAAQFWANEHVQTDSSAYGAASATLGSFASLWTPETAGTTITVLATANPTGLVGSTLARTPMIVQKTLLVGGTGLGTYQATTAGVAAFSGTDANGNPFNTGERVAKALEAVSSALMVGAGFMGAAQIRPRVPTGLAPISPTMRLPVTTGTGTGTGGAVPARPTWHVISEAPNGDITVVSIHHETEEIAFITINRHTGSGTAFSPGRGTVPIVEGQLVLRPQLGPGVDPVPGTGGGTGLTASKAPVLDVQSQPGPLATPTPSRPLPLTQGTPSMLRLTAPQTEDFSDLMPFMADHFGADATAQLTWSVTPDGTVFATPPLPDIPVYSPDAIFPAGQFYSGQPGVPMIGGPLQPGFTPFDVLPGMQPATRTLPQVRNTRGGNKARGSAAERLIAEQSGGEREVTSLLPQGATRRTDVVTPELAGTVDREVKNYLRYIGGRGTAPREVDLSAFLQTEINRDAMIMYYYPNHQPIWVFTDAPPAQALITALAQARIPYTVMSDRLPLR